MPPACLGSAGSWCLALPHLTSVKPAITRIEAAPRQEVMTLKDNEPGPTHPLYKAVQTD